MIVLNLNLNPINFKYLTISKSFNLHHRCLIKLRELNIIKSKLFLQIFIVDFKINKLIY